MLFKNQIKSNFKSDFVILYYVFLGIVQAMWTNPSVFPPLPLRLIMNFAVFVPMIFRKDCVVFGIPFFMILRGQLGTDYQYLPDVYSYYIYIPLLILLLLLHYKSLTSKYVKIYAPLIILIGYMWVIDILGVSECGSYVKNLFVAFLFSLFISSKEDSRFLSIALVCVCAILSVYYILMYNQFLETWDASEGIERSGWNDPNYFSTLLGAGLLITILFLLGYIKSDFLFIRPIYLTALSIIMYLAIILTASRAGFISSSLILLFAVIKSRPSFSKIIIITLVSLICITIMYKNGIFDTLLYRLFEQGNIDTGGDRTTLWAKVIEKIGQQPVLSQFFGGGYWHRAELSGGSEMHNELLAISADYGFIGLILFLILIVTMILHKDETYKVRLLAVIYYMLIIISLSPFQYVNIGFYIIWILSLRLPSRDYK